MFEKARKAQEAIASKSKDKFDSRASLFLEGSDFTARLRDGKYIPKVNPVRKEIEVKDSETGKTVLLMNADNFIKGWFEQIMHRAAMTPIERGDALIYLNKFLPAIEKGEYMREVVENGRKVRIYNREERKGFSIDKNLADELEMIRSLLFSKEGGAGSVRERQ